MSLGNLHQGGNLEHFIFPALTQRGIGHVLDMVLIHPLVLCLSLAEQMGFDLVDRRGDLVKFNQINHAVRVKIGNSNRPDFSIPVQPL